MAVTSLRADERISYPLHVRLSTPAKCLPKGQRDPAFRTKPQLIEQLVDAAREQGVKLRAVVADCFHGDYLEFRGTRAAADLSYVLALKPSTGI